MKLPKNRPSGLHPWRRDRYGRGADVKWEWPNISPLLDFDDNNPHKEYPEVLPSLEGYDGNQDWGYNG
jgi:hypothetical protein